MQSLRPAKIILACNTSVRSLMSVVSLQKVPQVCSWVYIGLLDAILCNSAYSISGIPSLSLLLNAVLSLFMR